LGELIKSLAGDMEIYLWNVDIMMGLGLKGLFAARIVSA
jgi:hypothetical protein